MWAQVLRDVGRHEPTGRSREERCAEGLLKISDLTAKCRLREAERPRCAGQAAFAQNGKESAIVAPVQLSHTNTYSY
jgi:hypothetical protein